MDKGAPSTRNKLILMGGLMLSVSVLATVAFHISEGWDWLTSAYEVVLTLSTVGHGTPTELTPVGKVTMSVLILVGVGTAAYLFSMLAHVFIEGELGKFLGRRKMERQVQNIENHFVVCGYGKIGRLVCRELAAADVAFVVIDVDEKACDRAHQEGYTTLCGDATEEGVLKGAGVERAKGLVTVMGTDAENVFVTMTARFLRRDLFIVARASADTIQKKLYRAGASRCISPDTIGGRHMAKAVLKPNVLEFIDLAAGEGDLNFSLDEITVPAGSLLDGNTLVGSDLRRRFDVIIVAIRKQDGALAFNPDGDTAIEAGDVLLALGEKKQVRDLQQGLSA